jgi:hypothetical protein
VEDLRSQLIGHGKQRVKTILLALGATHRFEPWPLSLHKFPKALLRQAAGIHWWRDNRVGIRGQHRKLQGEQCSNSDIYWLSEGGALLPCPVQISARTQVIWLSSLPQSVEVHAGMVLRIRLRPFPVTSFRILYSLIIFWFDAIFWDTGRIVKYAFQVSNQLTDFTKVVGTSSHWKPSKNRAFLFHELLIATRRTRELARWEWQ